MSELSPQARAFLDAHRNAGAPTAEDAARVRGALDARLAAPAAKLTLVKVGVAVVLGAVVIGLTARLQRLQRRAVPVEPAAVAVQHEPTPAPVVTAREAPPAPIVAPTPVPVPKKAPPRVEPRPEPVVVTSAPPVPEVPSAPVEAPAVTPRPDELQLLSEAEDLLRQGRALPALEVLERWEASFGTDGQFDEEARAARVVALCQTGALEDGRRLARALFGRYPASLQRNRIERACASPEK